MRASAEISSKQEKRYDRDCKSKQRLSLPKLREEAPADVAGVFFILQSVAVDVCAYLRGPSVLGMLHRRREILLQNLVLPEGDSGVTSSFFFLCSRPLEVSVTSKQMDACFVDIRIAGHAVDVLKRVIALAPDVSV